MGRGTRGFIARNRVRVASLTVVVAAAASLVAYALAAQGYAVHHARLNDGGIWVTKGQTGQYGRLNKPISQLDGAVYSLGGDQSSYDIDVLQDGAAVVAEDRGKGQLYPLDVTALKAVPDAAVDLPGDAAVAIGGGVLAVLDRTKGALRAMSFDPEQPLTSLAGLQATKPLAVVGGNGDLAVGQDGTIYAASPSRGLTTVPLRGAGFGRPHVRSLGAFAGAVAVTVAGSQPVVLETRTGATDATAVLPSGRTATVRSAAEAVLQQAGPATDDVLLATSRALIAVPLSGGAPRTLFTGGTGEPPARPVQLRGCLFGAWPSSGQGVYAGACSGRSVSARPIKRPTTKLVFRVNREQLLLNDTDSGDTWNVDSGTPRQVADWNEITPRKQQNSKTRNNHDNTDQSRALPPKPADDELGARPGHTTALYVLDNDSDPSGEILAVDSVSASPDVRRWLTISPDGQTVDIALPAGITADTTFKYVVRAAKGGTAAATVVVHARTATQNADPTLRKGAKPRTWPVAESGTLTIPVLSDWRDYTDGDPVVLAGAKATSGQVATTPDGALIYTAPAKPGPQTITYTVSDGHGGTGQSSVPIQVQPADGKAVGAEAQADYARGEVGRPVTVRPLANDLPGFDPLHPTATTQLAGDLPSPAGTSVRTDLASGTVTVTAKHPGTFSIGYQVQYGNAPLGKGTIRVDVTAAGGDQQPITAPDVAVLHGRAPVTVDVLANDSDPAGNLLVAQRAVASDPTQLQVAVVGGRFVRIAANAAHLSPASQTVTYTVSDGVTGSVTGEVTVTQLPDPADDTPIALADYATVRAGDSVAVPVLDNDSTPAGDPVSLVRNVSTAPAPGRLSVTPAIGAAYVSGALVRYVAPAAVRRTTTVVIDYYVQNAAGDRQQVGHAQVTITPPVSKLNPDQPPVPQPLEVRTVAGDSVTIKVPTSTVDPDGDSVVVTGIGSAPRLGRVTGFRASSITYQAYPNVGNGGTDTFQYTVSDTYGLTASGLVRVAVVPPGDPQPPVAVNDAMTVAPNATVRVDVLANDIVAPDDRVTITDLAKTNPGLPAGTKLLSPLGPVELRAGADVRHPVTLTYRIDDGLNSARASVTIRVQRGINLPPVAFDQYAQVKPGAASVTVDLLRGDYDPDGTAAPTVVSPTRGLAGSRLTLPLTTHPQVVPYVIKDAAGATSMATVYVPASGAGAPYAKPGAEISVPANGSTTVNIADYVIAPSGKPLRTTTSDTISASPTDGLSAKPGPSATRLILTAGKGYSGPAAVTFQVTDGTSLTQRGAQQAYVTVPVQVGKVTPVLRCPTGAITITAGAPATPIPVATVCHVWTPKPDDAARLPFTASWKRVAAGVTVSGQGTPRLSLKAGGAAKPGESGVLGVAVQGSTAPAQALAVQVVKARRLVIAPPIVIDGLKAGDSKTIDLRDYVDSPFGLGAPVSVVGTPTHVSGMPASVSAHGSKVTVAPAAQSHGTISFSFVVTDVSDTSRSDRQVSGDITLHVLGRPGAPTNVAASRTVKSNEVDLTWSAPADNGAPIDHYTVKYGAGTQTCSAAPACAIRSPNLHNGHQYSFTVVAHNAVGDGPASSTPATATPDAVPSAVPSLTASNPQDGALTLSWTRPPGEFSPVLYYELSWQGGSKRVTGAAARTTTITGLDNDKVYDFTIVAWNKKGAGPETHNSSPIRQSAGKPTTPPAPTVGVSDDTATDNRVVTLSWGEPAVDPQGPTPLHYTVVRTPAWSGPNACTDITATTCRDTAIKLDGTVYTYAVKARNNAGSDPAHTSATSAGTTMEAAATPDPITNIQTHVVNTTPDGSAPVTFDLGASHGKSSDVTCHYGGGECFSQGGYPVNRQQGVTATLTFPAGYDGSFTLDDCNGSSGSSSRFSGASCSTSAATSVRVNAPPAPPGNPTCGLNGTTVTFGWSGGATYGARKFDHYHYSGAASGDTTGTSRSVNEGYGGTSRLDVVLVDSNGESSGVLPITCPNAQHLQVAVYDDYNTAQREVFNCTGAGTGSPAGHVTQTMSVPANVHSITSAEVQIDFNSGVTVTASIIVNGTQRGSASASPQADTYFNFSAISVNPGDGITLRLDWSTSGTGTLNGVYLTGSVGGAFQSSNTCPKGGTNVSTSSQGLRARVYGYT